MHIILNVYVFRGKFENKDVAVKIIFPESPAFVDSNVIEMLRLYKM